MNSQLYELIMKVDFKAAEKLFLKMSDDEQIEVIQELVYDTESMIIYAFLEYVNKNDERISIHEIEFTILTNALCHIEGAYQMALYHNQRLLELVPNTVKYMEWMLSFYAVKVIDKERALNLAKKILEVDANSVVAKNILKDLM